MKRRLVNNKLKNMANYSSAKNKSGVGSIFRNTRIFKDYLSRNKYD